ncbi:MAG: hypothetical protein QJR08_10005 [Bacillota bacterium]|nr:hypothetical protein [Bacillota bacterium]
MEARAAQNGPLRELAEAQRRTEARLEALTARVDALAEAQRRTEARLEALTARVDALAEAQKRTEARLEALTARVDALAEAQRRTEGTVQTLVAEMQGLKRDVARLKGSDLERRFRERAPALLGRRFRRARVLPREEVAGMLDDAVDEGRLGWEDRDEILGADAVVRARDAEGDVWLVVEVSSVVDRNDAERAARRAEALRGLGVRAVPGVAGERFTEGAEDALASLNALAWRMEER